MGVLQCGPGPYSFERMNHYDTLHRSVSLIVWVYSRAPPCHAISALCVTAIMLHTLFRFWGLRAWMENIGGNREEALERGGDAELIVRRTRSTDARNVTWSKSGGCVSESLNACGGSRGRRLGGYRKSRGRQESVSWRGEVDELYYMAAWIKRNCTLCISETLAEFSSLTNGISMSLESMNSN